MKKTPSFLREDNKGTLTLRGLYHDDERNRTPLETASVHSSESAERLRSPRLSVLSECSELTPKEQLDEQRHSVNSYSSRRARDMGNNARVETWIRSSTDDVIPGLSKDTDRVSLEALEGVRNSESPSQAAHAIKVARQRPRLISAQRGDSHLPPTPDTMSPAVVSRSDSSTVGSKTGESNGDVLRRQRRHHHYSYPAGRPSSIETMESDNNNNAPYRLTLDIGDDTIHKRPSTATGLRFDSAGPIDVPQRPSTASTSTTFGRLYPRSAVSSHSLRQYDSPTRSGSFLSLNTDIIRPSKSPRSNRAAAPFRRHLPPRVDDDALDTEDWLEAAKMGPAPPFTPERKDMLLMGAPPYTDPSHDNSRQRPPSRFSRARNRLSLSSAPLKRSDSNSKESEGRKRRWLLPLLRRPSRQPSTKANDDDDVGSYEGAPAPVVHRADTSSFLY